MSPVSAGKPTRGHFLFSLSFPLLLFIVIVRFSTFATLLNHKADVNVQREYRRLSNLRMSSSNEPLKSMHAPVRGFSLSANYRATKAYHRLDNLRYIPGPHTPERLQADDRAAKQKHRHIRFNNHKVGKSSRSEKKCLLGIKPNEKSIQ